MCDYSGLNWLGNEGIVLLYSSVPDQQAQGLGVSPQLWEIKEFKASLGTRETAQRLIACVDLTKDPGWFPVTHVET